MRINFRPKEALTRRVLAFLTALVIGAAGILPASSPALAHDVPSVYQVFEYAAYAVPNDDRAWYVRDTIETNGYRTIQPLSMAPEQFALFGQSNVFRKGDIVRLGPGDNAIPQDQLGVDEPYIGSDCWFTAPWPGVVTTQRNFSSSWNPPRWKIVGVVRCEGVTDFPSLALPPVTTVNQPSTLPACRNGIDDNNDGQIDAQDPDCYAGGYYDPNLNYEGPYPSGQPSTAPPTSGCTATQLPSFHSSRWQIWRPAQFQQGIIEVHVWSDWAGWTRQERKILFENGERPGFRGGGSAWLWPLGCNEVARAAFYNNATHLPIVTLYQLRQEGLVE